MSTFEPPDDVCGIVEEEINGRVGESIADEKKALIRVLASRIVEERLLTKELHDKYLDIPDFEWPEDEEDLKKIELMMKGHNMKYLQRDSILKRLESLSRIISSIWNQLGVTASSADENFIEALQKKVDERNQDD